MSRALTVYSRREAALSSDGNEVERIMASQGCSEPVAKNLLKYAKLGIGPLAGRGGEEGGAPPQLERPREQFPPRLDKKAAALLAEQKLRERQEAEEQAEMQRLGQKRKGSGIVRLGPVMARDAEARPAAASRKEEEEEDALGSMFEASAGRPKAKKPMQIGGISRLGPVMSREEEVDPLDQPAGSKGPEGNDEEEDEAERLYQEEAWKRQLQERRKQQMDEDKKRSNKKKRRKDREQEEFDDEVGKDTKRARSGSPESPTVGADDKGGSLMSEKQVMAMMKREKKAQGSTRGSVRAASRIQKEKEEWEARKANNPEFWKAPQFALCYSAETGKKARGAG